MEKEMETLCTEGLATRGGPESRTPSAVGGGAGDGNG